MFINFPFPRLQREYKTYISKDSNSNLVERKHICLSKYNFILLRKNHLSVIFLISFFLIAECEIRKLLSKEVKHNIVTSIGEGTP